MPENGPYRDLDHLDRALDEFAVPDPYDDVWEPTWGVEHVAIAATQAFLEAADLTAFDHRAHDLVHAALAQPPADSSPAGGTPSTS